MKNLLFLALIGTFFLATACNKKVVEAVSANPPVVEAPVIEEPMGVEEPSIPEPKEIYDVLIYKKTACYGRCPIYEVSIKTDGSAIYEGKRFVEKEGIYTGKLDEKAIASIREKANEVGFLDMYNEYPTDEKMRIVDLPMTVTGIRIGDMIKEVRNRNGAPEKLLEFQTWIDKLVESINWQKKY